MRLTLALAFLFSLIVFPSFAQDKARKDSPSSSSSVKTTLPIDKKTEKVNRVIDQFFVGLSSPSPVTPLLADDIEKEFKKVEKDWVPSDQSPKKRDRLKSVAKNNRSVNANLMAVKPHGPAPISRSAHAADSGKKDTSPRAAATQNADSFPIEETKNDPPSAPRSYASSKPPAPASEVVEVERVGPLRKLFSNRKVSSENQGKHSAGRKPFRNLFKKKEKKPRPIEYVK